MFMGVFKLQRLNATLHVESNVLNVPVTETRRSSQTQSQRRRPSRSWIDQHGTTVHTSTLVERTILIPTEPKSTWRPTPLLNTYF